MIYLEFRTLNKWLLKLIDELLCFFGPISGSKNNTIFNNIWSVKGFEFLGEKTILFLVAINIDPKASELDLSSKWPDFNVMKVLSGKKFKIIIPSSISKWS